MEDDNAFDKDDALDYIIYEEITKQKKDIGNNKGCLSLVLLMVLPAGSLLAWIFNLLTI